MVRNDPTLAACSGVSEDWGGGARDAERSDRRAHAGLSLPAALLARFHSRIDNRLGNELLAAMRMGIWGTQKPPSQWSVADSLSVARKFSGL